MCLGKLDKEIPDWKTGYKVFWKRSLDGSLGGQFQNLNETYPVNEWISDSRDYQLQADCKESYETGFHFFRKETDTRRTADSDLEQYVCRKVKVRKIVASGSQWGATSKVGVAKEMFILDE